MRVLSLLVALLLLVPSAAAQARLFGADLTDSPKRAATLPDGFFLADVAGGARFSLPVAAVGSPTGDLYVVEKAGRIRVVRDGARLPQPFIDLREEVLNTDDRGLLGFALDPAFAANRYVYLSYVVAEDGRETNPEGTAARKDAFARVTRYTASADGTTVVPGSRRVLIGETWAAGIPACYYSHTIGTLQFGADGSLLVGTGDAADFGEDDPGGLYPECFGSGPQGQERFPLAEDIGAFRSQRVESLAGKILRVDPETGLGLPDNPFWTGDGTDNASRVWATGLRNPFRFAVGPGAGPGTVYVGDVGHRTWEEINVTAPGDNFGWPCVEGVAPHPDYPFLEPATNGCGTVGETAAPAFWWNHGDPALSVPAGRTAFSIIGGPVYAGARYPEAYRGRLFYADFASQWIATAAVGADGALSDDQGFGAEVGFVVHLGYNPATQWLTLTDVAAGTVYELRHIDGEDNSAPVVQLGASARQGTAPLEVAFSGSTSTDPDGDAVTFAWAFGDGATSVLADPTHVYTEPGTYTARLTVTDGFGASASAETEIVVRAGVAPTATIVSPPEGTVITAADLAGGTATLDLVGEAEDPDQAPETLDYRWDVALLHNTHVHPDAFSASGPTATYAVESHGADGDYYAIRLRLTVTDDEGLSDTAERVVPFDYTDGPLPPGWTAETLGAPVVEGASFVDDTGAFRVRGSGDLWGDTDAAEVATRALGGNGFLTARVASVTGGEPGGAAKAGVMLRGDLDASTPYAMMYLSPGAGVQFQWRETAGAETQAVTAVPESPASAWVRLERAGRRVRGYTSPDGADWTLVHEVRMPLPDTVRAGLAVTATDLGLEGLVASAVFTDVGVSTRPATDLPPFIATDLGATMTPGATTADGGAFDLRGGGDLWGRHDAAHLAYWRLAGDGALTARLDTLTGGRDDGNAKAGVMVRRGLAVGAPYALMAASAGNGLRFQTRTEPGASTGSLDLAPPTAFPVWLRVERAGDAVVGLASPDGETWDEVGRAAVPLGEDVIVALAATATDYDFLGLLATARFSHVAIEGTASALPRDEAIRAGLAPEIGFGITSVFPNPTRGAARVRLEIDAAGRTAVEVFDALGRRVAERSVDEAEAGARAVSLDLAGLSPGLYVIRAASPSGAVAVGRVTVVR